APRSIRRERNGPKKGDFVPKATIRVVSAAIERDGRYLITQRSEHAVLPLLWEFPGGRVEGGESDESALVRELHGRLGIVANPGERMSVTTREYEDYVVELVLYRCELGEVEPRPLTVHDMTWASLDELDRFSFTPADQESMDALLFKHH
ncbi:MAG: (deoxy)nucleoside triphosphate pyrophosphohydrolase, partial [Myxococcota bacterium]